MTITFFSNFMNHHQLPFCNEMIKLIGDDFKFIATKKIDEDRLTLGYEDMNKKYPFIIRSYENEALAYDLALNSDVVIIGSAPDKFIRERKKKNKLTFRYSERIFKNGFRLKSFISVFIKRGICERKNIYLLCSSAFSAADYNLSGAFKNKTFKWGYFPEIKKYKNINKLIERKNKNSILWVGRFLDWKHPEIVIEIAKMLRSENYDFEINMIGVGETFDKIKLLIVSNGLENYINLLGSMSPEKVRKHMENSKIFLFTSDRGEGWGAVLNEAMNSGCAVVASHAIGSVPFLIDNENNGLIYDSDNIYDLYFKVKKLLDDDNLVNKLGINAYNSMVRLWNAEVAAKRLLTLAEALLNGSNTDLYLEGPCSKAKILSNDWFLRRE